MEKLFPGSGQSCFPKTSQLWTPEHLLVPFSPLFLLLSQNTGPPTPSLRFWGQEAPRQAGKGTTGGGAQLPPGGELKQALGNAVEGSALGKGPPISQLQRPWGQAETEETSKCLEAENTMMTPRTLG